MNGTRRTPRYPFAAPAEITVEESGIKQLCRVKELSLYGCYLDATVPLAVKTRVLLKIYGPHDFFETTATVIYVHSLLGMGLAFREVKSAFAPILQKWLLQSMQTSNEQE
jgi:PilZ domain